MSDTPKTDVQTYVLDFFGRGLVPQVGGEWVKADFARELESDLAQRTEERDRLRAELQNAYDRAKTLTEERGDPLAEMWRELAEYQPTADANGHGKSWRRMCEERTSEEVFAAAESACDGAAAKAAYAAAWAASHAASDSEQAAKDAIDAIRMAKGGQP